MKLGVVSETYRGENRVALVPLHVPLLAKAGLEVLVETGAGLRSGYPDVAYQEKGARILPSREEVLRQAELLAMVRIAGANPAEGQKDLPFLGPNHVVVGFAEPLAYPQAAQDFARTGATLFAMELVPRITRAQAMDALSSMATIAGYKAALIAANASLRLFPMLTTAAGTIQAARAFVVGAGVAGLQAIATLRRLGAVVEAYDVRPAAKEQVQSLGARFVELGLETAEAEAKGGYAKEMGADFYRRQQALMAEVVARSDVVITTAAVPGKRAPLLITKQMVENMKPGSVIVDLAAERGGNCEVSRPGETLNFNGVTVIAPLNLPASVPYHASQMYSKNITAFILHIVKNGKPILNFEDEIVSSMLVSQGGKVVNPLVLEALDSGEQGG